MEIQDGVRRIGAGIVNAYLVEEARAVTIIDAGVPAYWGELPTELARLASRATVGRTVLDWRA